MRFKLFLLAAVAALATAMPARATIVFEWHLSSNQANTNYAAVANPDPVTSNDYSFQGVTGPAIPGNTLSLDPGQFVILQLVLHQIDSAGPNTITYQPGVRAGLIGYGFQVNNSAPALATHVQPSNNNANTRGVNIFGFNGSSSAPIVTGGSVPSGSSNFTIIRDITSVDMFQNDGFYPWSTLSSRRTPPMVAPAN